MDFTGPTLVAGSDTWVNYTVAARLIPSDDDGQGILLRYKNSTNFYRIALRSQNPVTTGVPYGLSIQKNVNRTYTEVYRESTVQYAPVADAPYDLVAFISGSTLNILLVADPEGTAQAYTYGPFNITGVTSGKIGLFSWGMSQAEFDWVSVQDGTPLYVSSPFGSPNPARGLNSFPAGTSVTASAGATTEQQGVRRVPNGWVGSGSVPANGSGSNVTFTLNSFSRLNWLWRTQYQLAVTNGPGGTVSFPAGEWFEAGSNLAVVAHPNAGFAFAGWTGTVLSTAPSLNLAMDQPYTLTATFMPRVTETVFPTTGRWLTSGTCSLCRMPTRTRMAATISRNTRMEQIRLWPTSSASRAFSWRTARAG